MFKKSNLKQVYTTGCGILLLAVALLYIFYVDMSNAWIFGITFFIGLSLLFLPDTLLKSLKKFLTANSEKQI